MISQSRLLLFVFLLSLPVGSLLPAQNLRKGLPREDVIDVAAVGDGLCVHNLFQSNMVLQRDKPISIWGWATVDESVTVSFANKQQSATAGPDRMWKVTFPAMPADASPQSMVVQGSEKTLELTNILIGDVWILGGQSNMEFPLERIENGNLEIISANYPKLRILTVPAQNGPKNQTDFPRLHEWSDWSGRHFRKGDWDVCSPEIAKELSAIGYVFARRIHMASGIPVGIIDASRGGTTVETWTPDPVLRKIETPLVALLMSEWDEKVAQFDPQQDLASRVQAYQTRVANLKAQGQEIPANLTEPTDLRPGPAFDQNRPGNCYASMIAPISGLAVKGAIFHQGYNNCFDGSRGAEIYSQIFPEMISAWRAAFNDPNLAFGIISLCTEGERQTSDNYCELMLNAGPFIREAQYQTFLNLYKSGDQNIGFVSSYDLRRRWYHPQLKIPAGERIARWALATQYGFAKDLRWKPPILQEMKVEEGRVILKFDDSVSAVDDGGPIEGFAIAGADQHFHPADADHLIVGTDERNRPRKDSTTLVLTSPLVSNPIHFRYAWGRSPLGNLQVNGNTDIPLATQRSDDWSMNESYSSLVGKPAKSPDTLERSERAELIRALQADDQRRKRSAAETLLREPK